MAPRPINPFDSRSRRRLMIQGCIGALVGLAIVIAIVAAYFALGFAPVNAASVNHRDFWWGLMHGFAAPLDFVVSIFGGSFDGHHITLFQEGNDGGWYDFGFLLGISAIIGGGTAGASK